MTDVDPATVLVGIDLSDPPFLSQPLLRQLSSLEVFLLGWQEVPDQTSTEQARSQFGDEAKGALESVASSFKEEGVDLTSRFAFTSDRFDAIERAAADEECDAVLIPRPSTEITRVLLSIRGLVNASRMVRIAGRLAGEETAITLFHVAEGREEPEDAERTLLDEAAEVLVREGVDESRIDRHTETGRSPAEAVAETAQRGDLVVIGESDPSSGVGLFSSRSEEIAREVPAPVLIVKTTHDERREDPSTRAAGKWT